MIVEVLETGFLPVSKRRFPFRNGKHFRLDPASGCWVWLGYVDPSGYGRCQIERLKRATKTARAHRISWMLWFDHELAPSADLHHVCENPACINPAHLEPLSRSVHQRRHVHADSVLSEADVIRIREDKAAGASLTQLAKKYGTTFSNVGYICRGKSWASVGGPIGVRPPCPGCGAEIPATAYPSRRYCTFECKRASDIQRQRDRRRAA